MERNFLPSLFLSYSYQDKELADQIADYLKRGGIEVMYDTTLLKPGDEIQETLLKSLRVADVVLVLITSNSTSSSNVMNELGIAQELIRNSEGRKLLLPLVCGDVRLPYNIANVRAIYIREPKVKSEDFRQAIADILKTIRSFFENHEKEIQQANSSVPNQAAQNRRSNKQNNKSKDETSKVKHYLLKLNPNTWAIKDFEIGEKTFANTYYFGKKRPEYELFKQVKRGDRVLGFATGEYQSIVCIMEVIKPVGPDTAQGEGFEMEIKALLTPPISLNSFSNLIPEILPRLSQNEKPPELFFKLAEDTFQLILSSSGNEVKEYENLYQPFYVTEGNHQATEDQLDFENDINSFAFVISQKKVNPPLAIGLFGNWGSGKSFFMEKLADRIDKIADLKDPEYVEHVVQVKFNSWHYSDTNLWASLITEIFDSLNTFAKKEKKESEISKLKRTLKTTSLEREVIDEKKKELELSIRELQLDQAEKRKKLEDISGIRLLKRILLDKRISKDLSELNNKNIENIVSDREKVDQYIKEVQDTGNKTIFFFKELLNLKGWRWIVIIATSVLVALAVPLVKYIFPSIWETLTWKIRGYTALTAAFFANIIATIKPYKTVINDALNRLQSLKKTIESREQIISPTLTLKENELNELKSSLINLDAKIENTKENISEILSGRRLLKFIDERTRDQNYNSSLGVISWIRKDFGSLDKLLREQHSISDKEKSELFNPENVQLKIDRVILYIDDLDRCNETVVVKVLEAIHLLLAFPLFVVIVGVDPRWLNNALSEKYKKLFGSNSDKDSTKEVETKGSKNEALSHKELVMDLSDPGSATSYDYLEKIFQIPFALKPINKTGREQLIEYLIREEMAVEDKADILPINIPTDSSQENKDLQKDQAPGRDKKDMPGTTPQTEEEKTNYSKKTKQRLVFTLDELNYMQKVSSLFGQTPRTINRYVNIYRIIKAHGSLKVSEGFTKREFMPIMFVLGVIVGCSASAEQFVDKILKSDELDEFKAFLDKSQVDEELKTQMKPLSHDIETILMKDFKKNVELISRFSFRTLVRYS